MGNGLGKKGDVKPLRLSEVDEKKKTGRKAWRWGEVKNFISSGFWDLLSGKIPKKKISKKGGRGQPRSTFSSKRIRRENGPGVRTPRG